MADEIIQKYCRRCGEDVTGKGVDYCSQCSPKMELAAKLSKLFDPENAELLSGLDQYLKQIAVSSQNAMAENIANGDLNGAAIECGVFQNAHSLITMIHEETSKALALASKPEGEES
jgi:hypothetical protein